MDFRPGVRQLNEDSVRHAVLEYASKQKCCSTKPAKEMQILDINSSLLLKYELESWIEERAFEWKIAKYDGISPVDGQANGPPPPIWSLGINHQARVAPFTHGRFSVEIPHTEHFVACRGCAGNGRIGCRNCMSQGRVDCRYPGCMGGMTEDGFPCPMRCNGGVLRCAPCQGNGFGRCNLCNGRGEVIKYAALTVTMVTQRSSAKCDSSGRFEGLPESEVAKAHSKVSFKQELQRVQPLEAYPDNSVAAASFRLINGVQQIVSQKANCRVVLQRHCVREVPATICQSRYKAKEATFYIYGYNDEVYFPEYYGKGCGCCCSLM